MTKVEFEQKIADAGLLSVYDTDGTLKHYIKRDVVEEIINDEIILDAFGLYKGTNNEFVIFVTDSERGIAKYAKRFISETDAYDALFDKIDTMNYIYCLRNNR